MKKLLVTLSLSLIALLPVVQAADNYETVEALWKGFDPRAEPLDVKVLKETTVDGVTVRTVQYSVETVNGFTARMVAYYAFQPGAKKLPAVLHVHGGGQNAVLAYAVFWARKGYAAMSINWGGKPLEGDPANGQTDWGPLNVNQDDKDSHNVYNMTQPDAHANSWYHWCKGVRRSITFLEQQPEVDPSKIGVYGISMGGRLMWLLAGSDTRMRCTTSIYGAALMGEPIAGLKGSEEIPTLANDPLWNKILDAVAYAPHIKKPFLYLSPTNDFFGRMASVDKVLALVPPELCWRSFAPHYMHQIDIDHSATLLLWMNYWLKGEGSWPKSPALAATIDKAGNDIAATVTPDSPQDVRKVTVLYTTDVFSESRFWRTADTKSQGSGWSANLPLTVVNKDVFIFANVLYKSGATLSTPITTITAADLKTAGITPTDAPTLIVDDFSRGFTDWEVPGANPNLFLGEKHNFVIVPGPDGGFAIARDAAAGPEWKMATHKIGDPKWTPPAGAAMQIQIKADKDNSLVVVITKNEARKPLPTSTYTASAKVTAGGWQTLTFPMADFKATTGGAVMPNWDDANLLILCGHYYVKAKGKGKPPLFDVGTDWVGTPPAIGSVKWVPAAK